MTVSEILTLISRCAFIGFLGCMAVYAITVHWQIRKDIKDTAEKERDYRALQKLSGDEYWKAYAEFKKKYQK